MNAPALPPAIAAFDDAQRRAIALARDVLRQLEAGMSERDIFELAETRLQANGFDGWYHAPEVRIGGGRTRLLPLPSPRRKLAVGDLVTLDVAPSDASAYGDFGATVCFGGASEPAVVDVARTCVRGVCGYASRWKTVGELQVFARAWAVNRRMELASGDTLGHRLLTRDEVPGVAWPKSAHALTLLRRNQVRRLNPNRLDGMYAVRPEVEHKGQIAAFEEVVYIHEDLHVVLGRADLEDAGTLGA